MHGKGQDAGSGRKVVGKIRCWRTVQLRIEARRKKMESGRVSTRCKGKRRESVTPLSVLSETVIVTVAITDPPLGEDPYMQKLVEEKRTTNYHRSGLWCRKREGEKYHSRNRHEFKAQSNWFHDSRRMTGHHLSAMELPNNRVYGGQKIFTQRKAEALYFPMTSNRRP